MNRRLARTLVIVTVLGFVTNVVVTALCVYGATIRPQLTRYTWDTSGRSFHVLRFDGRAKAICTWDVGEQTSVPMKRANPGLDDGDSGVQRPARWSSIHSAYWTDKLIAGAGGSAGRVDIAYGWPWLSFRGGWYEDPRATPPRVLDFGPALPELVTTVNDPTGVTIRREPRVVPLAPIVPGVIANTGVYGAAWWMVVFAPGVIRRGRRRRRGACVACGYDRRGIGAEVACPECGEMDAPGVIASAPPRAGAQREEPP